MTTQRLTEKETDGLTEILLLAATANQWVTYFDILTKLIMKSPDYRGGIERLMAMTPYPFQNELDRSARGFTPGKRTL